MFMFYFYSLQYIQYLPFHFSPSFSHIPLVSHHAFPFVLYCVVHPVIFVPFNPHSVLHTHAFCCSWARFSASVWTLLPCSLYLLPSQYIQYLLFHLGPSLVHAPSVSHHAVVLSCVVHPWTVVPFSSHSALHVHPFWLMSKWFSSKHDEPLRESVAREEKVFSANAQNPRTREGAKVSGQFGKLHLRQGRESRVCWHWECERGERPCDGTDKKVHSKVWQPCLHGANQRIRHFV